MMSSRNKNSKTCVDFNNKLFNIAFQIISAVYIFEIIGRVKFVKADWADGYFNKKGTCTKCQASWYTWINSYECTSWSNRILNATTNLWDTWPDGTFYAEALDECLDWKGSCSGQWASQNKCFDCSSNTHSRSEYLEIILKSISIHYDLLLVQLKSYQFYLKFSSNDKFCWLN